MPFTLAHTDYGDHAVIAVTGDLDLATAPDLSGLGRQLIHGGASHIVIDAAQVDFCDSSGLRALVQIANELEPLGGRVAVAGARPIVTQVLVVTGLDQAVLVVDSVAAAQTALGVRA